MGDNETPTETTKVEEQTETKKVTETETPAETGETDGDE